MCTKTRGYLSVMLCEDSTPTLRNMHHPPKDGNYCDEHCNEIKHVTVVDYNINMGSDHMSNQMTDTW